MRSHQDYKPYRQALLTKDELIQLNTLKAWPVILGTLFGWGGILAAWVIAWTWPAWWVVLGMGIFVGTRYYSLFIIAHDGLHRRLFASSRKNDLWNDVFILGAIGAITRINRANHMQHHRRLAIPNDPDRYKYISANKVPRARFLMFVTGLPYVFREVKSVFFLNSHQERQRALQTPSAQRERRDKRYTARDIFIVGSWQVALVGGLTVLFGWWGYILLWLAPVYVFCFTADLVRVFCEHSRYKSDEDADLSMRLASYTSSLLERQFFAPNNMNHHIAHHLWPSIPYYNLPRAEILIRERASVYPALEWRGSYLAHLISYWRWLFQAPQALLNPTNS